jgi:hypothetical protein
MDEELGLEELKSALLSCKDSAPGPDGIPYKANRPPETGPSIGQV